LKNTRFLLRLEPEASCGRNVRQRARKSPIVLSDGRKNLFRARMPTAVSADRTEISGKPNTNVVGTKGEGVQRLEETEGGG